MGTSDKIKLVALILTLKESAMRNIFKKFFLGLIVILAAFSQGTFALAKTGTALDKCNAAMSELRIDPSAPVDIVKGENIKAICEKSLQELVDLTDPDIDDSISFYIASNQLYLAFINYYIAEGNVNEMVCGNALFSYWGFSFLADLSQNKPLSEQASSLKNDPSISWIYKACAEKYPESWEGMME